MNIFQKVGNVFAKIATWMCNNKLNFDSLPEKIQAEKIQSLSEVLLIGSMLAVLGIVCLAVYMMDKER